ncbi:branched-chain amino acid transporter permease [Streptomyces alanosinicus]|uniref:Branched-chain amino acid transport protein n=1 Tax=Streptomyces alanosinicus TaxID=68171 RepID=A0A918YM81_9ACTN|nr:AzlD domain-containing protein [Streptomyces alanosinicus]GHE08207.1 putative branched-chain amino acid transport protein [Streptomyces alanosinicus]
MPDTTCLVVAVLVSAAVTWALRVLPFAVVGPLRASPTVQYLSTRIPAGIMVILVVYCLRDTPLTRTAGLSPAAALAVTVGVHLRRRNAPLSILAGTAAHVALASTVFAHRGP